MDAVDRTHVDTGGVLGTNARFTDDVGQRGKYTAAISPLPRALVRRVLVRRQWPGTRAATMAGGTGVRRALCSGQPACVVQRRGVACLAGRCARAHQRRRLRRSGSWLMAGAKRAPG